MVWQRTTPGPLFTEFQITVLSAVLFGIEGKDGECKSFPLSSLAKMLFPDVPESPRVARVRGVLNDASVVQKLKNVFAQDISRLPFREDREFSWKIRNRYPEGIQQVVKVVRAFGDGGGLVPYQVITVPEEVRQPKPEAKQQKAEKPISLPNWASGDGGQQKRAMQEQPPLIVSPLVVKLSSIFHYVNIVRGDDEGCGADFHGWVVDLAIESIVTVHCDKCPLTGDMLADAVQNALQKWAQLQKAMSARDNKVA